MGIKKSFLQVKVVAAVATMLFAFFFSVVTSAGVSSFSRCHTYTYKASLKLDGLPSVDGQHYHISYRSGRATNTLIRFKITPEGSVLGLSGYTDFSNNLGTKQEFTKSMSACFLKARELTLSIASDESVFRVTEGQQIGPSANFSEQQLFGEGMLMTIDRVVVDPGQKAYLQLMLHVE